jgi:hypothetical protein
MGMAFKCDLCGAYQDDIARFEFKRGKLTADGPSGVESCVADVCKDCVADPEHVDLNKLFHQLRSKGFAVANMNNPSAPQQPNIVVPQGAVPPGAIAR